MNTKSQPKKDHFRIYPIGYICKDHGSTKISVLSEFKPALKELETFSHLQIIWWFNKFDDEKSRKTTQFNKMPFDAPALGVFACRSPIRPNPIALTTAKILKVDHDQGIVWINNIDAHDGTPVLDMKAYFPHCDRAKNPSVPDWASHWPDWLPDEGLALED